MAGPAGTVLSTWSRNSMNSRLRWRSACRPMTFPSRMFRAANRFVAPCRLQSRVIVAGRPGFIGRPFRVRASAWIRVFPSIDSTTARSGGFMQAL